jgi:hypothetical protein
VRRNTTKYADSVESVYRHVIQKQKNDMAAEIIDAGRFDRKTTDAERKSTLEQIVADAERNKIAKNEVPTWDWIHRKLARSPEEFEQFQKIDEEMEWIQPWTLEQSPDWIRFTAEDVKHAVPERKRRRGELEEPSMTGWGAVKVCCVCITPSMLLTLCSVEVCCECMDPSTLLPLLTVVSIREPVFSAAEPHPRVSLS